MENLAFSTCVVEFLSRYPNLPVKNKMLSKAQAKVIAKKKFNSYLGLPLSDLLLVENRTKDVRQEVKAKHEELEEYFSNIVSIDNGNKLNFKKTGIYIEEPYQLLLYSTIEQYIESCNKELIIEFELFYIQKAIEHHLSEAAKKVIYKNNGVTDDEFVSYWTGNLKRAAKQVLENYEVDLRSKRPEFKSMKDASDSFFRTHIFKNYPKCTADSFYENVKKTAIRK